MEKLKGFLKKFGIWLLIGFLIGAILVFIFFFLSVDDEDEQGYGIDLPVQRIMSPHLRPERSINITAPPQEETFRGREWVYRVTRPEKNVFANFAQNFFEVPEEINMHEDIILTEGSNQIWYNPNVGTLSVFSEGLSIDLRITNATDAEFFFNHYFGIREAVNDSVQNTDEGVIYKGHFEYNDKRIGSSNIEGYSYIMELDSLGRLVRLSMLFLREENLERFQQMPTIELTDLLAIDRYPMKVVNTTMEERLHNQPVMIRGSVRLETLEGTGLELLFLIDNFEEGYIIPTYKIVGNGQLVDSRGDRYLTTSNIFISAIDPEYLYEIPKERFEETPHPNPIY